MNSLQVLLVAATAQFPQAAITVPYDVASATTAVIGGAVKSSPALAVQRVYRGETSKPFVNIPRDQLVAATPSSASIKALDRLRTFEGWGANWDGEGAPAPKHRTLAAAANVLGLLEDEVAETPSVALDPAGEPTFILIKDGREMSVTVRNAREIAFYVMGDDVEEAGLSRFSGDKLPKRLVTALRSAGIA